MIPLSTHNMIHPTKYDDNWDPMKYGTARKTKRKYKRPFFDDDTNTGGGRVDGPHQGGSLPIGGYYNDASINDYDSEEADEMGYLDLNNYKVNNGMYYGPSGSADGPYDSEFIDSDHGTLGRDVCTHATPSKWPSGIQQTMEHENAWNRSIPLGMNVPMDAFPGGTVSKKTGKSNGVPPYSYKSLASYSRVYNNPDMMSLGPNPSVKTGIFTDPITGQKYEAFEAAMPPPNKDYTERTLAHGARNRLLGAKQGGVRMSQPIAPRQELLNPQSVMQAETQINTPSGMTAASYETLGVSPNSNNYGVLLAQSQARRSAVSNFFKRDGDHPDGGPTMTGIPANIDGNQGNSFVRFTPNIPMTHRGTKANTSTGGTGMTSSAQSEKHVAQYFEAQRRLVNEQNRQPGMQATSENRLLGENYPSYEHGSLIGEVPKDRTESTNSLTGHGTTVANETTDSNRKNFQEPRDYTAGYTGGVGAFTIPQLSDFTRVSKQTLANTWGRGDAHFNANSPQLYSEYILEENRELPAESNIRWGSNTEYKIPNSWINYTRSIDEKLSSPVVLGVSSQNQTVFADNHRISQGVITSDRTHEERTPHPRIFDGTITATHAPARWPYESELVKPRNVIKI